MSTRAIPPDFPSLDSFGAPKQNYGVVTDPAKVITADDFNAMAATLAALGLAGNACWVSVSSAGALIAYGAFWGNSLALAPTCARTGTGVYTVTFASAYPDLLDGTSRPFSPAASNPGANTSGRSASSRISGQVVTVETYNVVGGAAADSAFTLHVNR